MRLVIDIGSNSSKCLLGKIGKEGKLEAFFEKSLPCRISAGHRELMPNAAQMISSAIEIFSNDAKNFLNENGICENFSTLAVATSALRESSIKEKIVKEVFETSSCEIKILSGALEAELSYAGALSDALLPEFKRAAYFDLGGGSLELVFGDRKNIQNAKSFPVGAVVTTKKFLENPTEAINAQTLKKMRKFLRETFENEISEIAFDILIGAGGSVVAARKIAAFYSDNDRAEISLSEIELCLESVCSLSLGERVQKFGIPENRADIIPAAFACIAELMKFLKHKALFHTYRSLRHGIISKNFA